MTGWPLTGRFVERGFVDRAVGLDAPGPYRGVVIVGAAGVGKTRLARESAASAAARGWVVHEVMGTAGAQEIPMAAFAAWTDGAATDPLHVVRNVIDAISATADNAPILLVVDDAHLLDGISAFAVLQLVIRRKVSVVVTIRTGEPTPDPITALWKEGQLGRLDLWPLSRGDSDELLAGALGGPVDPRCADRMWDLTAGNVLFLRQMVDHEVRAGGLSFDGQRWQWRDEATVPPSLIDVVGLQFGVLDEPVRDVVDLVAVAEPLELRYLEALCEATAIEDAERRDLISISDATEPVVRMGHPLYGEVRRTQSGPLRLSHLRGRLAREMTTPGAHRGPPDLVRVALLWLDSDLPPDQNVFTVAAWAAIMRLDLVLTERLAAAAIDAGAGIEVKLLRAQMLILLNQGAAAATALDALLATALPDPLRATVLVLRASNLLWILSEPNTSWAAVEEGLANETEALIPPLLAFRSVQLATAARPAEALALAADIDPHLLPPLPAMIAVWAQTIAAGDSGDSRRADELASDGHALAAAAPEISYETVNLACFHVTALGLAGHVSRARAVADTTLAQHADVPGVTRSVATAIAGMAALYNGDLANAVKDLGSAVAAFATHGSDDGEGDGVSYHANGMSYPFLILHADALARAGQAAAARDALTLMRTHRPPGWDYLNCEDLLAAAWVSAAEGDVPEACALAGQAARFARDHGQWAREVYARQTAVQFDDTDPTHVERLVSLMTVVDGPRAAVVAQWARARLDDDGEGLLGVANDLEALGDRIAAADAAAHATDVYTRQQRPNLAFAASRRAASMSTQCGAVTPATSALAARVQWTRREHDVATLMERGLSTKRIAAELGLSIRTVEGHVYRIYGRFRPP